MSQKIFIFLDMPHDQLLQRLRPLLSHDKPHLIFKITDANRKQGLKTKTVVVTGFPTAVFCSTRPSLDEQENTRLIYLSPEATQEKIRESIILLGEKLTNRAEYERKLNEDPQRQFLRSRVYDIKNAGINQILIENEENVVNQFMSKRKFLKPRHQRDFPRLIALIKACALLNVHSRTRLNCSPNKKCLLATPQDVADGFRIYTEVLTPNELSVSPETLEFYLKVFKDHDISLTQTQIYQNYKEAFHRNLSHFRLTKDLLPSLLSAGLLEEGVNPDDKRVKTYKPLEQDICTATLDQTFLDEKEHSNNNYVIKNIEISNKPVGVKSCVTNSIHSNNEKSLVQGHRTYSLTCGDCANFHMKECVHEKPELIQRAATYSNNCLKFKEKGKLGEV